MDGGEKRRDTRSDDGGMSQAAWARFYKKFYPRVRARVSASVANEHDAQDLVQQVFMELARIKVPEKPLPYLDAMARNLVAQYRGRRLAEQETLAEYLGHEELAQAEAKWHDGTLDPAEGDSREEIEGLQRVMARRLSPEDIELVTLRFLEGLAIKQVAQRMNCSENAVNKRLQKLRPILRRLYRE